jgi:hypothetical protein
VQALLALVHQSLCLETLSTKYHSSCTPGMRQGFIALLHYCSSNAPSMASLRSVNVHILICSTEIQMLVLMTGIALCQLFIHPAYLMLSCRVSLVSSFNGSGCNEVSLVSFRCLFACLSVLGFLPARSYFPMLMAVL